MREGRARAEQDELGLGAREDDIDPAPVLEEVADLCGEAESGPLRFVRESGGRGTHVGAGIAAHERDEDALLVAALTAVGGEDLDAGEGRLEDARQELDLLAVQRDDANVARRDAAGRQGSDGLCRKTSGRSWSDERGREGRER